jgi:hypothetical protein
MRTILFFLAVCFLAGCGGNTRKKSEPISEKQISIPVVDLSLTYPEKNYGDICELEYIPLETNDNILVADYRALEHVSDERIIVTNRGIGTVLIFDGKGKALYGFNHKGGGPKEYPNIRNMVYDAKNGEIFIFNSKSVIVYSERGEYKRHWYHGNIKFGDVFNFDDESFLAHANDSEKTDSSYVFLSKANGEILSFVNLPAENIVATSIIDKKRQQSLFMPTQQLVKDNDGFILSPISLDTVYRLTKEKQLVPLFTRTPSVKNSGTPSIFTPVLVTDRFILLMQYTLKLDLDNPDSSPKGNFLTYDRVEKRFYGDVNWDCLNQIFTIIHTDLSTNSYAYLLNIHWIKGWLENRSDKIDDKLKVLGATLDDDDNPVLEIIKFK